jgi:hypothetical protein
MDALKKTDHEISIPLAARGTQILNQQSKLG